MAEKIKITPEELQSQAVEMKTLESDFSTLFSGVSSELKKVNANWSPNLSHNFEGKINSAQNSFTQITQELMNGAKVADTCAVTFQSIDSELSKLYGTDGDGSAKASDSLWDIVKDEISDIPEDAKSAGEALAWIEQWYEKLPREVKAIVNITVPGSLEKAYQFTSDLLQGELTFESFWDVGKSISKASPYVSAVFEAFEYTFDTGIARSDEMQAELEAQIKEGDILGVVFDGAEGFVDTIIGGTVECVCSLAGNTVDAFIGDIPVVGGIIDEGVKYITGMISPDGSEYSIGDFVSAGGEAISAGLDFATDVITDVTDVVTSGITSGVKGVCSWVGGWFD